MKVYEVAVFNQQVRDKVRDGERHRELSDDWADMHYITFRALDINGARSKAEAKYPTAKGYVIEDISEE